MSMKASAAKARGARLEATNKFLNSNQPQEHTVSEPVRVVSPAKRAYKRRHQTKTVGDMVPAHT